MNCPHCTGDHSLSQCPTWRQTAATQPQAAIPGWKMVPEEPTFAMLDQLAREEFTSDMQVAKAAQRRLGLKAIPPRTECEMAYGKYHRMLAAVPSPPQPVDSALLPAVLALDAAIHTVLIAGGDYGDELSDVGLRDTLKQAQHVAYRALISIGIERLPGAVNPLRVFLPKGDATIEQRKANKKGGA